LPATPGPRTSLTISGAIDRADVPALVERLRGLLADDARDGVASASSREGTCEVICDVTRLVADLAAVDALARLELAARRLGGRIRLGGASADLVGLLGICGLADVLVSTPAGGPEARREETGGGCRGTC
jgi:STAS domain